MRKGLIVIHLQQLNNPNEETLLGDYLRDLAGFSSFMSFSHSKHLSLLIGALQPLSKVLLVKATLLCNNFH